MGKINPLKQIDFLFFYLKGFSHTDVKVNDIGMYKQNQKGMHELMIAPIVYDEIMQKLIEDKLIRKDENGYYYCTFIGRMFPGYEITEKERTKNDLREKANQKAIFWLTAVIAFGTLAAAIYYIMELLKICHSSD